MTEDAHQLYKEISRELNALSNDLTRGLSALSYKTKTNEGNVEELKRELRKRLDRLDEVMREIQKEETAIQVRLQQLEETRREHTGKINILEREEARGSAMQDHVKQRDKHLSDERKAKLALYTALGTGVLALISSLLQGILQIASGNG